MQKIYVIIVDFSYSAFAIFPAPPSLPQLSFEQRNCGVSIDIAKS